VIKTVIVCLCLLSVLSMASVPISDDKKIKHTLLKYNYGIIKMGRSGETAFFKEFVKEEVAMKLQVWFESWKFNNLTIVAAINDLRFSPIVYNESNATITTLENWSFSYVDLTTKKYALNPVNILYKMHYTLQKKGDDWMIVAIKRLEEKLLETSETHTPSLNATKKQAEEDFVFSEPQKKIKTH